MSENANETVFLTSEVEAKAGVVNCCDTAKWYGKDMTPEEKAELKKGQREWEKSRFRKWICQEALSAINESDVKKIKETGRQEGGKMNNHWCKVSAMVCITAEDVDLILYEALNAGGISAWSDAVKTVGDKLGKRVCEQVALGGELMIQNHYRQAHGRYRGALAHSVPYRADRKRPSLWPRRSNPHRGCLEPLRPDLCKSCEVLQRRGW